jgi:formate hydrogenlyase subunit 6/NADH:ubiquinone oxidoreductase subunit I
LFPPEEVLWDAAREGAGFAPKTLEKTTRRRALVGVRACELAALGVQDRVFAEGPYAEPGYRSRRDALFIVAVDCCEPGGTCFCASLGTGPEVTSGFDLVLTEVQDGGEHYFVAASGSEKGDAVLGRLALQPADANAVATARARMQRASERMGRTLDTRHLPELLYRNSENPRWSVVADRCLGCANCTCFCSNIEDVTDLTGTTARRRRLWDSCFTVDFSYLHGGSIRTSASSRYRQWLTHKLAAWIDQFGVSGCVGCGRCITWCPVGIDLTEELAAIRAHDAKARISVTHPEAIHGDT